MLFLPIFFHPGFEPTTSYKTVMIQGFKVRLSVHARKDPKNLDPAMALLRLRFDEIVRRVPKSALNALRKIPVWVEKNDPKVPCMCYHDSADWLKENGMNPDKAKGVELANIKNFVLWSVDQPLMLLHEYAHGYHSATFGFESAFVKDAYKNAIDNHLYDEVSYYRGQKKKGYAATDQMEYFAELSEALFGYNDFFPFTRPELRSHDPTGYTMVCRAWGVTD